MSEVRPNGERDGAAQLLASARARLEAALADLALPDQLRLSDWQRTTVAALLDRLVREMEGELRAGLAESFAGDEALHAALTSARLEIAVPILESADALREGELIAALLQRAEEHRLSRPAPERSLLVDLAGDEDGAIAAEAMSLLIAHSSRLDAYQEPIIGRVELPAELEHRLVWTVAAALRQYIVARHEIPAPVADEAVAASAEKLLSGYDEGRTVQALALRLVRELRARGRLDDGFVVKAVTDGSLPLFLAALAARTGFEPSGLWEILSDSSGRGAALLLRAAGLGREPSAAILLHLLGRDETVAPLLDLFDAVTAEDAAARLGLWRLDPLYRAAVARLAA